MKKSLTALLLAAACTGAMAEFTLNPDPNTLWKEDGKAVKVVKDAKSSQAWMGGKLEIKEAPGGGFTVKAFDPKKYSTLRYVPLAKEYPYLVYRITGVEELKGYQGYTVTYVGGGKNFGQVRNTGKGIFAVRLFEHMPFPGRKSMAFRMDLHGQAITFDYIKQVREPENYVFAESEAFAKKQSFSKGDTIKFTVKLADPAEDVTVRLFNPYLLQQYYLNGQDKVQLKPVDESCKVWSAEVKVNEFKGNTGKSSCLLLKAVVLGSEKLKEPLWGASFNVYK